MARASQWERVLFELRKAGRTGVTTNFIRSGMVPPIANPSQRILELEARGHVISSTPEKREGHATIARYRLERDADRSPMGVMSGGGVSLAEASLVSDSDPIPTGAGRQAETTQPLPAPASPGGEESFESLLAQLDRPAAYDPYSEAA